MVVFLQNDADKLKKKRLEENSNIPINLKALKRQRLLPITSHLRKQNEVYIRPEHDNINKLSRNQQINISSKSSKTADQTEPSNSE